MVSVQALAGFYDSHAAETGEPILPGFNKQVQTYNKRLGKQPPTPEECRLGAQMERGVGIRPGGGGNGRCLCKDAG